MLVVQFYLKYLLFVLNSNLPLIRFYEFITSQISFLMLAEASHL